MRFLLWFRLCLFLHVSIQHPDVCGGARVAGRKAGNTTCIFRAFITRDASAQTSTSQAPSDEKKAMHPAPFESEASGSVRIGAPLITHILCSASSSKPQKIRKGSRTHSSRVARCPRRTSRSRRRSRPRVGTPPADSACDTLRTPALSSSLFSWLGSGKYPRQHSAH